MRYLIILGIAALFLVCVASLIYIILLKRQMRNIKSELKSTRDMSYNRQITISLIDKDLEKMCSEINRNLDYQKQLKLTAEMSQQKLKQSVSDIAHDLRTPLTIIKGNLQMLSESDTLSEKDRTYLKTCEDKSEILKNMVDDFFEMSVLESDNTPAQLKEVDLTRLIMQFIVDNEAVIRNKGLVPDIRLPEKSVVIPADEQMLNRMLGNLLGNVLKYADESFTLAVEIMEREGSFLCDISFSNKISDDADIDVGHMFDRTYRGNRARTGQGAGLGLYIVWLLAQKQGARVYAEKAGQNLCVHMEFPMK